MDSAIAPHLRRERVLPTRKGADFQPPYPSFSARFPTTTTTVVMAYLGVQYPGDTPPDVAVEALTALRGDLGAEHGAKNVDLAQYVDEAGYGTRIVIAYWDDPQTFDTWSTAHPWVAPAGGDGSTARSTTTALHHAVEGWETASWSPPATTPSPSRPRSSSSLSGHRLTTATWPPSSRRQPGAEGCESDPVTHGNEYYFCLNHHRVEGVDGCSAPERLGPYPDEATAARALEIVQERNEAADEYDES